MMSADDWARAQALLQSWPALPPDHSAEGTCRRLRDAITGLHASQAGWLDVASLIRQILLEHEARHGVQVPLRVPAAPQFPTREQWHRIECAAVADGQGYSVTARPWHPPIGPGEDATVAGEDMRRVLQGRRPGQSVDGPPPDPFWDAALGYPSYLSLGQRQSARTVVLAPPGSMTIVCLPTGHGKTEVALAAALLASRDRGTSVLVVPTVVLALDLERRIRRLIAKQHDRPSPTGSYAYTGGQPDDVKDDLRTDVQEGRQRVIVSSPEALMTGLSDSLHAAAESGYLKYLIIDEAHLVDQWGSDFRPEFQTMASQRLAWLTVAPPRQQVVTVAMSATLTQRHIRTLTDLFGTQDEAAIVWSSETRAEPSYFLRRHDDEQARDDAVAAAAVLLPRPLFLYATRKADVASWVTRLHEAGARRVAQVTGDSDDEHRRSVVEGLRGEDSSGHSIPTRFDLVVGTSAFGLGVDVPDIRSVVHACVPETVDRYYQEVGRGGRDRRPSIAYLAAAPEDDLLAKSLNRLSVITASKGWDRWQSMLIATGPAKHGIYEVSLDSCPTHMSEGYERNRQWNVRTLNLMVWAGLIRLRAPEPPDRDDGESEADWNARLEDFYSRADARVAVEITDGATNRRDHWQASVSAQRTVAMAEQRAALDRMQGCLAGDRCIGESIADYYRVRWRNGVLMTGVNCRSCPWCRRHQHARRDEHGLCRIAGVPFPAVHSWVDGAPDPLASVRGRSSWLSISWADMTSRADLLPQLLERLVRRGMSVIGGPGLDARLAAQVQESALPAPVITDYDEDLLTTFSGPVIWILDDTTQSLDGVTLDRLKSRDLTYLLHPYSLPDPDRAGIRLVQVCDATISLSAALGVL